jgi:hypothetical protein
MTGSNTPLLDDIEMGPCPSLVGEIEKRVRSAVVQRAHEEKIAGLSSVRARP